MGTSSAEQYLALDQDAAVRRDALVIEHLPQVRLIARRIHARLPQHISLDDLISTGIVGLLEAIDHFDPALNVQLKTYAERRIHGAIMDSLRDLDWAPRDTRKKAKQIEQAIHKAKQRLGREPSGEEIAAEMGATEAEYHEWLASIQGLEIQPLEYVARDGSESSMLKFVSDDEENWPSRVVERNELERILALAIDRMPKMERNILNLYYFDELSLGEIAQVVGLHLSRVAQLRIQAVLRLRSHLERVWPSPGRSR